MPYYYSSAPYFLFVAGLLAGLASGSAFSATLKQQVNEWDKNRSTRTLANLQGPQLSVPFLGISAGICVFLGAGLEIFGFPTKLAYAVAIPLTILTALLVWTQLARLLAELERGGSKALDLDSFS
ncbi:MAG: hypothetical protein OHK0035_05570 [Cyanobacteria bacterium J069]